MIYARMILPLMLGLTLGASIPPDQKGGTLLHQGDGSDMSPSMPHGDYGYDYGGHGHGHGHGDGDGHGHGNHGIPPYQKGGTLLHQGNGSDMTPSMTIPPCMSTCNMSKRPTCDEAKAMCDSCAASCSDQTKDMLLKMAGGPTCSFGGGSTGSDMSPSMPHDVSPGMHGGHGHGSHGGHGGHGGSYCDTTGPDTNPCCGLNSKTEQDACLHFCDTTGPDQEPCCAKSSRDEQATCRAKKGPLTPAGHGGHGNHGHGHGHGHGHSHGHGHGNHGNHGDLGSGDHGDLGSGDHGSGDDSPQLPPCVSTCDTSKRPTCDEAKAMCDSCAASCSDQTKDMLLKMAGGPTCKF